MPENYDLRSSALYRELIEGRKLLVRKNQVFQTTDYRESLTLISQGYVKRYKINNSGSESIQGIYGPDDIFPVTWMLKVLLGLKVYDGPETFYYETMTDAVVHTISQEALEDLAKNDPGFYKTISYIAGVRLKTYIHNFENISLQGTEKRLAHQLYFHAKHFGTKTSKGTKILVPFKQKDLASLIDVTRETVSVNLKTLRERKLVDTGSFITVKDLEGLENLAYS